MSLPKFDVREGVTTDDERLHASFGRTLDSFRERLEDHAAGACVLLVAAAEDGPVGHLTIRWTPQYPEFRDRRIPEIQDLNVMEPHRRRGIATRLMDEAERRIAVASPLAGIGLGLHPGYRAAQVMYVRRGYVPDGRGVYWKDRYPREMEHVTLDEDLVLHLTKALR